MGHTKPQDLHDLKDVLAEVRALEGLKEKNPGIFYFKSKGFLHFHDKDGKRWADVKVKGSWQELEIDFFANNAKRKAFLGKVVEAHRSLTKGHGALKTEQG
jgi:hypothetical protein